MFFTYLFEEVETCRRAKASNADGDDFTHFQNEYIIILW